MFVGLSLTLRPVRNWGKVLGENNVSKLANYAEHKQSQMQAQMGTPSIGTLIMRSLSETLKHTLTDTFSL